MAYFSKIMSLKEITDHIYSRANVITRTDRPHMFTKELGLYIDYLRNKIEEINDVMTKKQEKYFSTFVENLNSGISYYQDLFSNVKDKFQDNKNNILEDLKKGEALVSSLSNELEKTTLQNK